MIMARLLAGRRILVVKSSFNLGTRGGWRCRAYAPGWFERMAQEFFFFTYERIQITNQLGVDDTVHHTVASSITIIIEADKWNVTSVAQEKCKTLSGSLSNSKCSSFLAESSEHLLLLMFDVP
jgi:hypothetical protein